MGIPHPSAPKISVIIPLYNKAPYIKRALDSVLAQTVQDFEIVVVNDGSTDGGEKIVEILNDSRIRLINQNNLGVSAARNNGVDAARAELAAFLDADDEWLPEFLETILQLRNTYPDAGMYTTGHIVCKIRNNKIVMEPAEIYGAAGEWTGIIPSPFRCAVYSGRFPATASSVSIPKKIFTDLGGFQADEWWGEDWDLWGRIALNHSNAHCSKNTVIIHIDRCCGCSRVYDKVSKMDYHPFQKSIDKLCTANPDLKKRLQTDSDLLLFLERLNIELASCKILSRTSAGRKKGRVYLRKVHDKLFRYQKIKLYLLSYIPAGFAPCLYPIIDYSFYFLRMIKNRLR